ncbi:MAG: hypothetical protein AAF585_22670, partial [Verrucomicrobiota bacterium]
MRASVLLILFGFFATSGSSQDIGKYVDFLLDGDPFRPSWKEHLKLRMEAGEPPLPPIPPKTDPGENAEPQQLLAFWEQSNATQDGAVATPQALNRLATVLVEQPNRLPAVLANVPAHDGLIDLARDWMENSASDFPKKRSTVRNWLFAATGDYQDEVEFAARGMEVTDRGLIGEAEIELLIKHDLPKAKEILKERSIFGDSLTVVPIARVYLLGQSKDDTELLDQLIEDITRQRLMPGDLLESERSMM